MVSVKLLFCLLRFQVETLFPKYIIILYFFYYDTVELNSFTKLLYLREIVHHCCIYIHLSDLCLFVKPSEQGLLSFGSLISITKYF